MQNLINDVSEKMDKSVSALKNAFNKIRTGRANPSILDDIKVDYYGNLTPINQTSNISVEEGRSLVISPWDKNLIPEIEKAIHSSDLGLNPSNSSDLIRVTMPALTEETRQDYIKQARAEAENSRVSIRNIRRDANLLFAAFRSSVMARNCSSVISNNDDVVGLRGLRFGNCFLGFFSGNSSGRNSILADKEFNLKLFVPLLSISEVRFLGERKVILNKSIDNCESGNTFFQDILSF